MGTASNSASPAERDAFARCRGLGGSHNLPRGTHAPARTAVAVVADNALEDQSVFADSEPHRTSASPHRTWDTTNTAFASALKANDEVAEAR